MDTTENNIANIDFSEAKSVALLNETGTRLCKSGEMQKAEENFLKAIELDPNYPQSYHNLGILQAAQHRTTEAIKNVKKLIELEPDNAEHYCNLGIVYFLEGSYYESELFFSNALKIDNSHPDALFNLGKLFFNLERTDEAISMIERYQNIDSTDTDAMFVLGMCYLKKNDKERAKAVWNNALVIDPGLGQVRKMLQDLDISGF